MAEAVTQPDHPGRQCHEVHPGVPHTVVKADSQAASPAVAQPLAPLPPQPQVLPVLGHPGPAPAVTLTTAPPDWSRFDEWATRALEFLGDAVTKADQVADQPPYLGHSARQEAARVCADLAIAASPYSMGAGPSPIVELADAIGALGEE